MKKWIMAVMLLVLAGMAVSANAEIEERLSVAATEVAVINGHRQIVGVAHNTTGEVIQSASLMFNLYDSSGAKVGETLAIGYHIEPNVPWRFRAAITEPEAASYRLISVSAP